jgi:adenine/guanine phosphoribosyltransferase-like PRPP-binding protein
MDTPHDDDGCSVCGGPTRTGFTCCFCCSTLVRQLQLPLAPVVAMAEYRVGDPLHRRLRGYKDAPVAEVRRDHAHRLAGLAEAWMAAHGRRLTQRFGADWDVVATVPSSCRPSGPPVDAVVSRIPMLNRDLRPVLARGPDPLGHLRASRRGFELRADADRSGLRSRSVLVVDDSITTGARAQSAVAAIRLGGVEVIGILVLGRAVPRVRPAGVGPGDAEGSSPEVGC